MWRWYFHPVAILVYSILALASSLFLYIFWYVEANSAIRAVARTFHADADQFTSYRTWVVVSILSILVGIILMNIIIFFVYNIKNRMLVRTQKNFINNFTHELKTPVTSLRLYLETFQVHDLPGEDRERFISYMLSDVDRLSGNINSILNLARIESKSFGGTFKETDLREFVKRFVKENQHRFPGCRLEIEPFEEAPLAVNLNPGLFEMLLMNLVSNAAKYNDSEAPEVKIRLARKKRHAEIRFADNGMGLAKKHRKRIFKKFYQVGSPDNMSAKGNGLGLYMVRLIAKAHKAKVRAESEGEGKGSTFVVSLPLKKAKED